MRPNHFILVFLTSLVFLISGCTTPSGGNISADWGNSEPLNEPSKPKLEEKSGPPSHAQAHGYRKKHTYRYYPNEYTYYDSERSLYFYFEGEGWKIAASLPNQIKLSNDYVTINLKTDKPYRYFNEHSKKYPSKKIKKKKNKKY